MVTDYAAIEAIMKQGNELRYLLLLMPMCWLEFHSDTFFLEFSFYSLFKFYFGFKLEVNYLWKYKSHAIYNWFIWLRAK